MADLTNKKINLATNAVIYATQLVDAINGLTNLRVDRLNMGADFQDSDFVGTPMAHLTAGMIGVLFDFVVPTFQDNLKDVSNSGRNQQILSQVRK